jgi:hypothetical protein
MIAKSQWMSTCNPLIPQEKNFNTINNLQKPGRTPPKPQISAKYLCMMNYFTVQTPQTTMTDRIGLTPSPVFLWPSDKESQPCQERNAKKIATSTANTNNNFSKEVI